MASSGSRSSRSRVGEVATTPRVLPTVLAIGGVSYYDGLPVSNRHWHYRTPSVRRHRPALGGRADCLFGRSGFADDDLGLAVRRIAAASLRSTLGLSCTCSAAIRRDRKFSNSASPAISSSKRCFRTAVRSQAPINAPRHPKTRPNIRNMQATNAVARRPFLLKALRRRRGGARLNGSTPARRERFEKAQLDGSTVGRSCYRWSPMTAPTMGALGV